MARRATFPLKYKLLLGQFGVLAVTMAAFLGLAGYTFIEDKKLSIRDYSISLLEAASTGFALQMRLRLEGLERVLPLVAYAPRTGIYDFSRIERSFNRPLQEDLLRITFYRVVAEQKLERIGEVLNTKLLLKKKGNAQALTAIDVIPLTMPKNDGSPSMQNRTTAALTSGPNGFTVLTIGLYFTLGSQGLVAASDFDGGFLQREMSKSELAEMFLLGEDGSLLTHMDRSLVAAYATVKFPHPIVRRFRDVASQAENHEVEDRGRVVFSSFGRTAAPGIFAVAQIPKDELYRALMQLAKTTGIAAAALGWCAFLVTAVLAGRMTRGLQKLQRAAELAGDGQFDFAVGLKTNDELSLVAESFDEMTEQISRLLNETQEKARMEEELKTASLLQSTILSSRADWAKGMDFAYHYASATECSGDFWDASVRDDILTIAVADATGHGVSAALVTGVAKSCLATVNRIYSNTQLAPEHYMTHLNDVIHEACQGKLLMTMVLAQINLKDGTGLMSNAGHEFPLCFRAADVDDAHPQRSVEELISRGERLGFLPGQVYESHPFQLFPGDAILLYTDGVVENPNKEGTPWGDRQLRKAFAEAASLCRVKDLAATPIVERILDGYAKFVADAPPKDDVTLVATRWKPFGR